MQARDEANEAAFSSLDDLGEEEEEDRELREKKEKVSLLGLIPPLGEIDPRVMVELWNLLWNYPSSACFSP